MPKAISHSDFLQKQLQDDPEFAKAYLNEALHDEDPATFYVALRHVVTARGGGVAQVAQKTGKGRESLYKTLSDKGNPEWVSILTVIKSLGYDLAVS